MLVIHEIKSPSMSFFHWNFKWCSLSIQTKSQAVRRNITPTYWSIIIACLHCTMNRKLNTYNTNKENSACGQILIWNYIVLYATREGVVQLLWSSSAWLRKPYSFSCRTSVICLRISTALELNLTWDFSNAPMSIGSPTRTVNFCSVKNTSARVNQENDDADFIIMRQKIK